MPCLQLHSLNSEEFCLGILMRLGLPIPSASHLSVCLNCNCGEKVDPQGLHLLTCGKGPGRVRLQDRLVRALAQPHTVHWLEGKSGAGFIC